MSRVNYVCVNCVVRSCKLRESFTIHTNVMKLPGYRIFDYVRKSYNYQPGMWYASYLHYIIHLHANESDIEFSN